MAITLAHQIQEIDRELAVRAAVYPRWVHAGKMRQGEADLHIERMRAVKVTLEWLQTNEIRALDSDTWCVVLPNDMAGTFIRDHIASKKEERQRG